jgi:hypothetical protein
MSDWIGRTVIRKIEDVIAKILSPGLIITHIFWSCFMGLFFVMDWAVAG